MAVLITAIAILFVVEIVVTVAMILVIAEVRGISK